MKTKHTPGPWELRRIKGKRKFNRIAVKETGQLICAMFEAENEEISNARLIAAAPELLDALRELNQAWGQLEMRSSDDHLLYKKCAAAIRKATEGDAQ